MMDNNESSRREKVRLRSKDRYASTWKGGYLFRDDPIGESLLPTTVVNYNAVLQGWLRTIMNEKNLDETSFREWVHSPEGQRDLIRRFEHGDMSKYYDALEVKPIAYDRRKLFDEDVQSSEIENSMLGQED